MSQDDEGQQRGDVELDTPPIHTPPLTDVKPGPSSPTSQVTGHVGFSVAENPAREMAVDHWKLGEHLTRSDILPIILMRISRQTGNEITVKEATKLIVGDERLREMLTAGWERGSFVDIRRLGEYPPFLPQ